MDLTLWNERLDNGTWRLMGELGLETRNSNSSIWGGFCLGYPDAGQEKRFDCMVFKVVLDLEDLDGPELPDLIVPFDEDEPDNLVECTKVTIYDAY